ncbi:MAG: hypothetical protein ACXIVQ_03360 [Acidimicrobiales bacterium]
MTDSHDRASDDLWVSLFATLADISQPLFDAGWALTSTDADSSSEHGDSVFYGLERGGVTIELEYFDHGRLVGYPVDPEKDDDEPTEPFFAVQDGAGEAADHFATCGWL